MVTAFGAPGEENAIEADKTTLKDGPTSIRAAADADAGDASANPEQAHVFAVPASFAKLAPFARRAGIAVTGRARLRQQQKRLEFLLITEDIAANSERELRRCFQCPVVKCFSVDAVYDHLGFRGTKVVGFRRSSLARSLYRICRDQVQRESDT